MRGRCVVGALAFTCGLAVGTARDARACGGFFPPIKIESVVTDHRMILSISPQQTTLYDQIEYQGSPESFAWVLPIHGPVTVGVSADALFGRLDALTQVSIEGTFSGCQSACPSGSSSSSGGGSSSGGAVTVIRQQVVGPYATVQLHSSDPNALSAWLTDNQFAIPASAAPIIATFVQDGFDFLAVRLVPGQGVSAMRPISVTSPGAGLSLPLRMIAAGAGPTVGLTLWVIGQGGGRYEPMNYPTFQIAPSEITWDATTLTSDYESIRSAREASFNDTAWQIESSVDISRYSLQLGLLDSDYASADLPSDGGVDASLDASLDSLDGSDAADQRLEDDLTRVLGSSTGASRVTRMRADLSQAALANDITFQAAVDQSPMPNLYLLTKTVNMPVCHCPGTSSGGTGVSPIDAAIDDGLDSGSGSGKSQTGETPSQSGCAVGAERAEDAAFSMSLTGLLGAALVRTRRKKRQLPRVLLARRKT